MQTLNISSHFTGFGMLWPQSLLKDLQVQLLMSSYSLDYDNLDERDSPQTLCMTEQQQN